MLKDFYNAGRFEDPASLGVSMFDLREGSIFIEGNKKQVKRRNLFIAVYALIFKFVFLEQLPSILDVIVTLIILVLIMDGLYYYFKFVNRAIKHTGIIGILYSILFLIIIASLLGVIYVV